MSPVSSNFTPDSARPNSEITSIWRTSAMPPCNTRTSESFSLRALGTVAASQSSVAMRSENTTTRVLLRGSTPISRSCSISAVSLEALVSSMAAFSSPRRSSAASSVAMAAVLVPSSGVSRLARVLRRATIVSPSARCDDSAGLKSVHGNRVRPLPDVGAVPDAGWIQVLASSANMAFSASEASMSSGWG